MRESAYSWVVLLVADIKTTELSSIAWPAREASGARVEECEIGTLVHGSGRHASREELGTCGAVHHAYLSASILSPLILPVAAVVVGRYCLSLFSLSGL